MPLAPAIQKLTYDMRFVFYFSILWKIMSHLINIIDAEGWSWSAQKAFEGIWEGDCILQRGEQ